MLNHNSSQASIEAGFNVKTNRFEIKTMTKIPKFNEVIFCYSLCIVW